MKLFSCVYEVFCEKCPRTVLIHVTIPIGKSYGYGCRECRTPLFAIQTTVEETHEIRYYTQYHVPAIAKTAPLFVSCAIQNIPQGMEFMFDIKKA